MHIVKIRRVGNSNVISLPRELEAAGYTPGKSVVIERTNSGGLTIVLEEHLRDHIRTLGLQVIEENQELLALLDAYDRGNRDSGNSAGDLVSTP